MIERSRSQYMPPDPADAPWVRIDPELVAEVRAYFIRKPQGLTDKELDLMRRLTLVLNQSQHWHLLHGIAAE